MFDFEKQLDPATNAGGWGAEASDLRRGGLGFDLRGFRALGLFRLSAVSLLQIIFNHSSIFGVLIIHRLHLSWAQGLEVVLKLARALGGVSLVGGERGDLGGMLGLDSWS